MILYASIEGVIVVEINPLIICIVKRAYCGKPGMVLWSNSILEPVKYLMITYHVNS